MKRIGLVLSGGMGKGAYQIGALSALQEYFSPSDFDYISSASVGAINSYAYATNQLDHAKNIWLNADPKGNKRFITSVLKSEALENIVNYFDLEASIPCHFYVPLFELKSKELDYFDFSKVSKEQLDKWLQASITLPVYNKGIEIDDKTFFDGAMIDNIPVLPVVEKNLDYIICIYFDDYNYVFENTSIDDKIIKLVFADKTLISNSIYVTHDSISYMVETGYKITKEILKDVFQNGTDDLPFIYEKINERNRMASQNKLRITGDVVMTNINKYAKRLVRNTNIYDVTN